MPAWSCPDCSGGFPFPAEADGVRFCPWCGTNISKDYEERERVLSTSKIAREKRKEKVENAGGLFGGLFE